MIFMNYTLFAQFLITKMVTKSGIIFIKEQAHDTPFYVWIIDV